MKKKCTKYSMRIAVWVILLAVMITAVPLAEVSAAPPSEVFDIGTALPRQGTNWYYDDTVSYFDNNGNYPDENGVYKQQYVTVPTLFVEDGANLRITGNSGPQQNRRIVVRGTASITLDNVTNIRTGDAIRISEGIPDPNNGNPATYVNVSPMMLEPGAKLLLTLMGENTLAMSSEGVHNRWSAALGVPYGASLEIDGDGSLYAEGGLNAAAIGSHEGTHLSPKIGGDITIHSGTITAVARGLAAAIGGGSVMQPGNITIYGGKINAAGGSGGSNNNTNGGAGIGGGDGAPQADRSSTITISGGEITARGGAGAAGIGGGNNSNFSANTINIYGGTVNATGGSSLRWGGAGIGGGFGSNGGNINISGGIITAAGGGYLDVSGGGAAGIGGGALGNRGNTNITGGIISAVGGPSAEDIGASLSPSGDPMPGGQVTIGGGAYVVDTLPSDKGLVWINEQPQDASVTFGNIDHDLSVSVGIDSGISLTPAYQWHTNREGGVLHGDPVVGATSSVLELPSGLAQGVHYFFVDISFPGVQGANLTSNTARVEVLPSSEVIITAIAGSGGSVSGGGAYQRGDTVSLVAIPDEGYEFEGWYKNNIKISESAEINFTAEVSETYEARFLLAEPGIFEITNIDMSGEAVTGNTLTFSVSVSGGTEPVKFAYYIIGEGQVHDKLVYSDQNIFTFTPENSGNYSLRVYAIDSNGIKIVSSKNFSVA